MNFDTKDPISRASMEGLCPPPTHPDYKRERGWQKFVDKAVEKDIAIQQSMSHLNDSDKEFMNVQRKRHANKERLLTTLIHAYRKHDSLPKRILLEASQEAIKHIYEDKKILHENERKNAVAIKEFDEQLSNALLVDESKLQEIEEIANEISKEEI